MSLGRRVEREARRAEEQNCKPHPWERPVTLGRIVRHVLFWAFAILGVLLVDEMAQLGLVLVLRRLIKLPGMGSIVRSDDFLLYCQIAAQLVVFCVFGLWWLYLRPRSFARWRSWGRPLKRAPKPTLVRFFAIAVAAVAVYLVIGIGTDVFWSFFPQKLEEYAQIMEDSGTNELTIVTTIVLSVGAPLSEEVMFRGVLFEFALRLFNIDRRVQWSWRAWRYRVRGIAGHGGRELARKTPVGGLGPYVSPMTFWLANASQAAVFGIMHGNIVQASYTFFFGLMLGWIMWQTGCLRYGMLLHLVFNFTSFFNSWFQYSTVLSGLMLFGGLVLVVYGCFRLFELACTNSFD